MGQPYNCVHCGEQVHVEGQRWWHVSTGGTGCRRLDQHPSERVQAALVRLNDELCSWERSTGRQSVLILREQGGFVHRSASGKPNIPDDVEDETLWSHVRD